MWDPVGPPRHMDKEQALLEHHVAALLLVLGGAAGQQLEFPALVQMMVVHCGETAEQQPLLLVVAAQMLEPGSVLALVLVAGIVVEVPEQFDDDSTRLPCCSSFQVYRSLSVQYLQQSWQ